MGEPVWLVRRERSDDFDSGHEVVAVMVRCGTNPGGPQAHWVRSYFVDHTISSDEDPTYNPAEWFYLPSRLDDNPYLDQAYERRLLVFWSGHRGGGR